MNVSKLSSIILSASIGLVGCSNENDSNPKPAESAVDSGAQGLTEQKNIIDTAIEAGSFTTLYTALQEAGLVDVLKADGPYTVFAPTDEAFAKIPADTLSALLADKEALTKVLLYHVVPGSLDASAVLASSSLNSANDMALNVNLLDGAPYINNSAITATDIAATNGVIHVIDTVLLPPAEQAAEAKQDVVDQKDIIETAIAAGKFTTLFAAIQEAGLVETLKSGGPFTVFAPTDEAFAKIPAETLNSLLADKDALTNVLLYHVVPGVLDAGSVLSSSSLDSANNLSLSIELREGTPYINDSMITATDIIAENGIIHVIDTVLLPPAN